MSSKTHTSVDTASGGSIGRPPLVPLIDPADFQRVERVIAFARVVLAMAAIVTIRLDPTEPSQYGAVTLSLLFGYTAIGSLLLILLLRLKSLPYSLPLIVQAVDVCFAALLTLFSQGPNSPLFVFLLYPLLAAGYRWGFREVMATAIVVGSLMAAELLLIPSTNPLSIGLSQGQGQFGLNTFIFRVTYVVMAGAVVGYLAENERRRRFETSAISQILAQARLSGQLSDTLNLVLVSLLRTFGAKRVLFVVQEKRAAAPVLLWKTEAAPDHTLLTTTEELREERRGDYLFEAPGVAWHAVRRSLLRKERFNVVAVNDLGRRVRSGDLTIPPGFLEAHRCRRLVGVSIEFGDEWTGRLLLLDPAIGVRREQNAQFALRIAHQVGPAVYGHYVLDRLRTRAQAVERGRIARELHDGITQSLLGLEMEMAVLRRRALTEAPKLDDDLARIHGILRNEIISLRELMEGLRVGDVETGDIVGDLAEMVERFRRYTGIVAQFVSDRPAVVLPLQTRREVARIVHEGLVNVRKHSGARRVLIRAGFDNGSWKLSIEDDGRGFPFAGRHTHAELDARRQGPRMIGERVRRIGGEMSVVSRPGSGARVEVAIPLEAQAS